MAVELSVPVGVFCSVELAALMNPASFEDSRPHHRCDAGACRWYWSDAGKTPDRVAECFGEIIAVASGISGRSIPTEVRPIRSFDVSVCYDGRGIRE